MEEQKVRKHTTSSKVRNRWNEKHYDRINVTLPKGYGDIFKDYCDERNTTMNAILCAMVKLEMDKWQEEKEREE